MNTKTFLFDYLNIEIVLSMQFSYKKNVEVYFLEPKIFCIITLSEKSF